MTRIQPTVSVILATYNRAGYIREALDSLLDQTRAPDAILVVDDGSTDGTADVVARYGDRVRYLHKENGGRSAAVNLALQAIDSDYVWIFDDDDVALPHSLASHLSFLATHPEYDFSYSPQHVFSGEFSHQMINTRPRPMLPGYSGKTFFVRTMESMHSMMQGMLVPRRCYQEVGPFDETFIRAQDHEMLLRLARRFCAGCLNEPTFALRMHDGLRGSAATRHSEKDRARVWATYRQRLFKELHAELALVEYLPELDNTSELSSVQKRRALAQRFCIAARNGVVEHALDDYRQWRELLGHEQPSEAEAEMLSRATQVEDTESGPPGVLLRQLGHATGRQKSLLYPLMRGLYWSAMREFRQREARNTCTLAGSMIRLGWSALTSADKHSQTKH